MYAVSNVLEITFRHRRCVLERDDFSLKHMWLAKGSFSMTNCTCSQQGCKCIVLLKHVMCLSFDKKNRRNNRENLLK